MKANPAIRLQLTKYFSGKDGFTLVELLIVITLIFLIVSLITTVYLFSANTTMDVVNTTKSEIDSRVAMYRISKDLREAASLLEADENTLMFTSNIDSDEYFEEIRYYLESENDYYNLMRSIDGDAGRIVIKYIVNNELFNYFSDIDVPENGYSRPVSGEYLNDIKIIKITLYVDQGGNQGVKTMSLESMVSLRNKI